MNSAIFRRGPCVVFADLGAVITVVKQDGRDARRQSAAPASLYCLSLWLAAESKSPAHAFWLMKTLHQWKTPRKYFWSLVNNYTVCIVTFVCPLRQKGMRKSAKCQSTTSCCRIMAIVKRSLIKESLVKSNKIICDQSWELLCRAPKGIHDDDLVELLWV